MRKRNTVRETITYPNVKVTPETDPCRDKSLQHEHVLDCGHLIITPKPDEPCAPNCHHIATSRNPRRKHRKRPEILRFYCDACVETANEAKLSPHLSSAEAESFRALHRHQEAARQGKDKNFRSCYIGQKITSIPCDEDGDVIGTYITSNTGHHFDTALPRTGVNMFEDIDAAPPSRTVPKRNKPPKKATSTVVISNLSESDFEPEDESSSAGEGVVEDIADTLAEGAKWLQEQDELARRRQETGTSSTRGRRAAARPIISSSPDIRMSDSIVSSSNPMSSQTSHQTNVESPQKSRKRKRTVKGTEDSRVSLQPMKQRRGGFCTVI